MSHPPPTQRFIKPSPAVPRPLEVAPPVIAYRSEDPRNPQRFPFAATIASAPTADGDGVGIRLRNPANSGRDLIIDRADAISVFATRDWYVNRAPTLPFPSPGNLAPIARAVAPGGAPTALATFSTALTAITFGDINGICEGGVFDPGNVTKDGEFAIRPGGLIDIVIGLMSGGPSPSVAATDFFIVNLLWTEAPASL